MNRRTAAVLVAAAIAAPAFAHQPSPRSAAELMDALMWNREPVGGPFALVDHAGRKRTDRDFRGRFLLVYFGFTRCPDVCPSDLQEIALALRELGPGAEAVQPVFVTLDPQHDTQAVLARYVAGFHPRLLGLTGSEAAVRAMADAYRMYFRKLPTPDGGYTIEHAAFTYLMDREGKYAGFFPPGTRAQRMLQVLRAQIAARS